MRTRDLAVALVLAMGTGCASDVANLDESSRGGTTSDAGATFNGGTKLEEGGATIGGAGNVAASTVGGVGGSLGMEMCGIAVDVCFDGIVTGRWGVMCSYFSVTCGNGCRTKPGTLAPDGPLSAAVVAQTVESAYCEPTSGGASSGGASSGGASSGGASSGGASSGGASSGGASSGGAPSGGASSGGASSGGASSGGASMRRELCTINGSCHNGTISVQYGWFCWQSTYTCEYGCVHEGFCVANPYFDTDPAIVSSIAKASCCKTSNDPTSGGASSGGTSNLSTTTTSLGGAFFGGASSGGASLGGTSSL